MSNKHWLRNLPEIGRPLQEKADKQEQILAEIAALEDKIFGLKKQYADAEHVIMSSVKDNWSPIEIAYAKTETVFIKQNHES